MEIKGYTYGYNSKRGMYLTERARQSRLHLMEIGVNWVCLAFSVKQKTFTSTEILYDYRRNVTDLEIMGVIKEFHDRGIKVCLKPMIDTDDGVWRAQINFPDSNMFGEDKYWKEWFNSYRAYLTYYAELAQYCRCEMLCLGCEMLGTERREADWRETVAAVKEVYSGLLTYNTNHGKEEEAKWYDLVDYVGTSAYYPVEKQAGASFEEMCEAWEKIADRLETVSRKLNKPILFMEIGCRSAAGCAAMPWDFMHRDFPVSEEEQARFYRSSLEVMSKRDWFAGYFWWDWSTYIYETREQAAEDRGFNIYLKQAEEVVKEYYAK